MHPTEIQKWLKELMSTDFFQAEIAFENDMIAGYLHKLTSLELTDDRLALEYAEIRGAIRALRDLQERRKRHTTTTPT